MKRAKTERVETRVSKRVKNLILNSEYSFSYALEFFADNNIGDQQKNLTELHLLQKDIKIKQDELYDLFGKEAEIKEKIGFKNKDGIEISPIAQKHIQTTLDYYKRKGFSFKNVEDFLNGAEKNDANFIESQAYLSNLGMDEFKKLVILEADKIENL